MESVFDPCLLGGPVPFPGRLFAAGVSLSELKSTCGTFEVCLEVEVEFELELELELELEVEFALELALELDLDVEFEVIVELRVEGAGSLMQGIAIFPANS